MYSIIRPLLFQMDAERAHRLVLSSLSVMPWLGRIATKPISHSPVLHQSIWDLPFKHPICLAAGLDKNAEAVAGFFQVGFSAVEVGTVTPLPQPGNPSPRLFRLVDDEALINRMGFNNVGAQTMLRNLQGTSRRGVVGVNLGKNKWTDNEAAAADYTVLVRTLYDVADYFVLNVSSPNTPGLRDLQALDSLLPLIRAVRQERDAIAQRHSRSDPAVPKHVPPILVKLAPDLSDGELEELSQQLALDHVDGLIATNTTISRSQLTHRSANEAGGLSGRPLKQRSTEVIRLVRQATNGTVPIIASGGVFTAADAYEKIQAGASLVQIYTAIIYRGPEVVEEIVNGLEEYLQRDGFRHIRDAIGTEP